MSAHGGAKPASLEIRSPVETVKSSLDSTAGMRTESFNLSTEMAASATSRHAFRNFGVAEGESADQIYRGLDTAWETQVMFAKLMRRMAGPFTFGDGVTSAVDKNFNPRIPAGYTYLGQFVAHDIIRNSSLLPELGSVEVSHRNLRERPLCLDALYGRGPQMEPALYEPAAPGEGARATLRMSSMDGVQVAGYEKEGKCPFGFRDIPRFGQNDLSGRPQRGRPDILIPDSRNDDNAMVAQITALFHHLHNAVVTALRAITTVLPEAVADAAPRGLHLFLHARRITTLVYRRVIRDDLLKRLLSDDVWTLYSGNGFMPLVDRSPDGVPVEFSHAAYRLGHSMVRMSYVFNDEVPMGEGIRDALRQRSAVRSYKFPVSKNWIADWSHFFDLGGKSPQPGRRIGPGYNDILLSNGMFGNTHIGSVPGVVPSTEDAKQFPAADISGLLLSDLIRGVVGGLQTLDGLIARLPDNVVGKSSLLSNPMERKDRLNAWLRAFDVGFKPTELAHLSANPPLLLWLLCEAAFETNGQSLGTLGSVLVGDVFMARLIDLDDEDEAAAATTARLAEDIFQGALPSTMPAVILFIAQTLKLHDVMPAFATTVSKPK